MAVVGAKGTFAGPGGSSSGNGSSYGGRRKLVCDEVGISVKLVCGELGI